MRLILTLLSTGFFVGCLLGGCQAREAGLSEEDRATVDEYVSTEAPTPEHPLEVQLEAGVQLLGYRVQQAPDATGDLADVESISTGRPVTITWYWHTAQDLDSDYRLFTHAVDGVGQNRKNFDIPGALRGQRLPDDSIEPGLYQPARWQAGEYIRDVQTITLAEHEWSSRDHVGFLIGIYYGGGPHRLGVVTGDQDGTNRIRTMLMPVTDAT